MEEALREAWAMVRSALGEGETPLAWSWARAARVMARLACVSRMEEDRSRWIKSRGDRLEHRAVVGERGHQGALLHRLIRTDDQVNWKSHKALFRVASAIDGT